MDLMQLIPNSRLETHLGSDSKRKELKEVADLVGCSAILLFEPRKKENSYLWISKHPEGPSAKFFIHHANTMHDLKLRGNHIKGSRPVLSFQKPFNLYPDLLLIKELFKKVFVLPISHKIVEPYFDHVLSFSIVENRIFIRNYQVISSYEPKFHNLNHLYLNEVGPRFCLSSLKILEGSFAGSVLYKNPHNNITRLPGRKNLTLRNKTKKLNAKLVYDT